MVWYRTVNIVIQLDHTVYVGPSKNTTLNTGLYSFYKKASEGTHLSHCTLLEELTNREKDKL